MQTGGPGDAGIMACMATALQVRNKKDVTTRTFRNGNVWPKRIEAKDPRTYPAGIEVRPDRRAAAFRTSHNGSTKPMRIET